MAGGGFDQCYNAQAAVAAGSLLVVASAVSQAPNDKQQLEPMLDKIEALADELGKPECLLADTGYFSAANVAACDKAGIEPLIAMGRQPHHPPLAERFQAAPEAPQDPTPVEASFERDFQLLEIDSLPRHAVIFDLQPMHSPWPPHVYAVVRSQPCRFPRLHLITCLKVGEVNVIVRDRFRRPTPWYRE